MYQNQSYQQLSPHEVALIYRNSHALFKERALSLIQKEDLNAPNLDQIQTQMVEFLVLCAQLNLNPYFFPGGNLSSHQLENTIEQLKYMKNKEILLKPLEQEGLIQRDHNYLFMPPVFKDKSRIYFKINPLYSYKALLTQAINWMNSFLPSDEHVSLIEKEETAFVLKGNQLVRPVHFLLSILKQCEKLRGILNHNTDLTFVFEKVLSTLSPHDKYAKRLSYFLKHDTHFPPCRLDFILLRYLCTHKERPLYQELIDFERKIQSYQENLQEMSVRNEKNKSNEDFIDLIILSVRPHDIATMSTFTEWNTCMTAGSSFYMDIAKQIGAGSVIAYGVNSKNPYKRLARILLRPYVSAHTYKKLKHLEKL